MSALAGSTRFKSAPGAPRARSRGLANIVRHSGGARTITIALEKHADAVRMTIADDGAPFNPATHPVRDLPSTLEDAQPGGLGLHVMRTSADLVYRRLDGWNALSLTIPPVRSS